MRLRSTQRQRSALSRRGGDAGCTVNDDLILLAEQLRHRAICLGGITGAHDVEHLLDALFGRFCIGK